MTLLFAELLVCCAVTLFVVMQWVAVATLEEGLRAAVTAQLAALQDDHRRRGLSEVVRDVRDMVAERDGGYALVLDSAGRKLAGNLPSRPARTGWITMTVERASGPSTADGALDIIARGVWLNDGANLLIGRDASSVSETREVLTRAFAVALVVTLMLALGGAFLITRGILKRLAQVGEASQRILAGDMSGRLPARGTGDEFDQLIDGFNALLDRISALMETVRQVTNDIAHDLRTPLTRLVTRLEEARRKSLPLESVPDLLDRSIAEARGVLEIFAALLRIAQIESDTNHETFVAIDGLEIVDMVAELYLPLAEQKQQVVEVTGASVPIRGDRELLIQMLSNLAENSCHHTQAGSSITLSCAARGTDVVFAVQDNGPGISDAEHERVFRRFYRVEAARSTPGYGLGLGLVAAIAAHHGGRVRMTSCAPGLRVEVVLPRAADSDAALRPRLRSPIVQPTAP